MLASADVAQHTKDTVQVWRDCASLRIMLHSALQAAHRSDFAREPSKEVVSELDSSVCLLLNAASARVSSKRSTDSDDVWESIRIHNETIMEYCLIQADIWHERTKAPNRNNLKALDQSISSQMEYVMNDPDQRAVKRCRGVTEDEYDDGPLYAALLKESVQKGASGDEYAAMRMASKFGKKASTKEVDRRASKGRKIRYSKIDKLVNFMAARPVPLSEGVPITDERLVEAFVNSVFSSNRQ